MLGNFDRHKPHLPRCGFQGSETVAAPNIRVGNGLAEPTLQIPPFYKPGDLTGSPYFQRNPNTFRVFIDVQNDAQ